MRPDIAKMSLMNLIHSNGISPLGAFNSNCSSRAAMNMFAYDGATGVPKDLGPGDPCKSRTLAKLDGGVEKYHILWRGTIYLKEQTYVIRYACAF